jgi:MinD-like ATPase involved in chromosome partitioning or flagellar assembly
MSSAPLTAVVAGVPTLADAFTASGWFTTVFQVTSTGELRELIRGGQLQGLDRDRVVFVFADDLVCDTPQTPLEALLRKLTSSGYKVAVIGTSAQGRQLVEANPAAGLLEVPFSLNMALAAMMSLGLGDIEPVGFGFENLDLSRPFAQPAPANGSAGTTAAAPPAAAHTAPADAAWAPPAAEPADVGAWAPPVEEPVADAWAPPVEPAASVPGSVASPWSSQPVESVQPAGEPSWAPPVEDPAPVGAWAPPVEEPVADAWAPPVEDPAEAGSMPWGASGQVTTVPVESWAPPVEDPSAGQTPWGGQPQGYSQDQASSPAADWSQPAQPAQWPEPDPSSSRYQDPYPDQAQPAGYPDAGYPDATRPAFAPPVDPATGWQPDPGQVPADPHPGVDGWGPPAAPVGYQDAQEWDQSGVAGQYDESMGPRARPGSYQAQHATAPRRGFVITVAVPKGGTGKSTLTINLATYLALRLRAEGKYVCIMDANVQQADIGKYLHAWSPNITHLVKDQSAITKERITQFMLHREELNLSAVLGPPRPDDANPLWVNARLYNDVLDVLQELYDYIIIDTQVAEKFSDVFRDFILTRSDFLLVPVTPNFTTVMNADNWLRQAVVAPRNTGGGGFDADRVGIVLNRYEEGIDCDESEVRSELTSWHFLGSIPETKEWKKASNNEEIVATKNYHELNDAFARILYAATGEPVLMEGVTSLATPGGGFSARIKKLLGRG